MTTFRKYDVYFILKIFGEYSEFIKLECFLRLAAAAQIKARSASSVASICKVPCQYTRTYSHILVNDRWLIYYSIICDSMPDCA